VESTSWFISAVSFFFSDDRAFKLFPDDDSFAFFLTDVADLVSLAGKDTGVEIGGFCAVFHFFSESTSLVFDIGVLFCFTGFSIAVESGEKAKRLLFNTFWIRNSGSTSESESSTTAFFFDCFSTEVFDFLLEASFAGCDGVFLAGISLAGVFLAGVSLAGVSLTGVFLAGVFFAGVFFAEVATSFPPHQFSLPI
jgi:hypothetical protein